MRALERLETVERRLRTPRHALINQLAAQAGEEELGGKLPAALADRLRITKAEAHRRIAEADDLGERRALTGEPLAPTLTATAAAQRDGLIGDGHVKVIRDFMSHLPAAVDPGTREAAEADLAGKARDFRPDQVATYAREVMALLHPDGDYSDEERARKRGIILGKQEYDGMSRISGMITPELRALIEAAWAKLAAPGACNPEDQTPVVENRTPPAATPAANPNATTTPWSPASAPCSPPGTWAPTTGYRCPSSSPPRCRIWRPRPARPVPAGAPWCRCPS